MEPKDLVARLDEVEGQMKALLLDTSRLAVAATAVTVKFHESVFDLQKVTEDVDLVELVNSEDIQATAEEIIKKVDL